ncbi:MAG: hypothetical protein V7676_12200 [Parasphingorhabdus sp.]|uniref:hypothetical protein n=1 Tax=Parasphingorhabdus sp. TaxID=2709688 RepID=UPI0030031BC5
MAENFDGQAIGAGAAGRKAMMQVLRTNRWALALADLSLLMLGFVILSFAHPEPPEDRQSANNQEAIPPTEQDARNYDWPVSALFEPREAMLTPAGQEQAKLVAAASAKRAGRINLSIRGKANGSARLDHWELSAARMAAFARALTHRGVEEAAIIFGRQYDAEDEGAQRLIVAITDHSRSVVSANGTRLAAKRQDIN